MRCFEIVWTNVVRCQDITIFNFGDFGCIQKILCSDEQLSNCCQMSNLSTTKNRTCFEIIDIMIFNLGHFVRKLWLYLENTALVVSVDSSSNFNLTAFLHDFSIAAQIDKLSYQASTFLHQSWKLKFLLSLIYLAGYFSESE